MHIFTRTQLFLKTKTLFDFYILRFMHSEVVRCSAPVWQWYIPDTQYCGIFAQGKNCEASRDSRCQGMALQTCLLLSNSFITQRWSNWEAAFSMQSLSRLHKESIVHRDLVQLGSHSWKVPASKDRSCWTWKLRTLHRWKPLPSSTENIASRLLHCCILKDVA
jgi:hypothetical protein